MPTRTLGVALWEYHDQDGRRRRAYFGQTFDLPEAEEQRGERAEVFDDSEGVDAVSTPDLPPRTSTKPILVDWLADHRGAGRDTIKGLNKAALWELIEQPKDAAAQQDS